MIRNGAISDGYFIEVTELTREDLGRLRSDRAPVGHPARIRESHHMVARFAAMGMARPEIARRTGYSNERISILLGAPAMKDLVATYREKVTERYLEQVDAYMETMFSNMTRAERHISDHLDDLDDAGELLPVKTALAISRDAADRLGYGKHSTQTNVNVDFAERLQRALERTKAARVVEGTSASDQANAEPRPHSSVEALPQHSTPQTRRSGAGPQPTPQPKLLRRA